MLPDLPSDVATQITPGTRAFARKRKHIEDLKAMFVYAPDTRIEEHPVKIESGEWTSVIGAMIAAYLFWDNQTFLKRVGVAL